MPGRKLAAAVGDFAAVRIKPESRSRRNACVARTKRLWQDHHAEVNQPVAGAKRRRNFYFRTRRIRMGSNPVAARDWLRYSGCRTVSSLECREKRCVGAGARALAERSD